MKSLLATGSGLLALALATSVGLPSGAMADDSVNKVNDAAIQTQQMDYMIRNGGGYVIQQDQYSDAVGGRNATMISPAPRVYVAPEPSVVVVPATPGYVTR